MSCSCPLSQIAIDRMDRESVVEEIVESEIKSESPVYDDIIWSKSIQRAKSLDFIQDDDELFPSQTPIYRNNSCPPFCFDYESFYLDNDASIEYHGIDSSADLMKLQDIL